MTRPFKPSLAVPLRAVQCRAPLKNGDEAGRRCKKAIIGGLVPQPRRPAPGRAAGSGPRRG